MAFDYNLFYANFSDWVETFFNPISDWLHRPLFSVGDIPITTLNIIRFIVIIILTVWFSHFLSNLLSKVSSKRLKMGKSRLFLFRRLFQYSILFIGFFIAISAIGFNFSSILVLLGALGVGLGFGLQSIFSNFISGLILLFESDLKVGDFIELESGTYGEITEINFRSTVIATNDGTEAIVPNLEIISHKVINWTLKHPYRRIHVPFHVAYGIDKEKMARVVIDAAKKVPKTLTNKNIPEPIVDFISFGDSAMNFELAVWVNDSATKSSKTSFSDYLWAIETALRENDIPIGYPQLNIKIDK